MDSHPYHCLASNWYKFRGIKTQNPSIRSLQSWFRMDVVRVTSDRVMFDTNFHITGSSSVRYQSSQVRNIRKYTSFTNPTDRYKF